MDDKLIVIVEDWIDIDYIQITGPYGQKCTIAGGDFESLLSALCAVRHDA